MRRLVIVFLTFTIFNCCDKREADKYNFKIKKIVLNHEMIYIKTTNFGVSSDKEIMVISDSFGNNINYKSDMIFEGIRNINLYFIKDDTLHIVIDLLHAKNKISKNKVKVDSVNNQIYYDYFFKNKKLNTSISIHKI